MIISIFLRHFKIYKGINFIPISDGQNFSSIIGENGVGKSSIIEALDFIFNKRDFKDWPINNEAKYEGGIRGANIPFIAPVFLIKKDELRNIKKDDAEQFKKTTELSDYLWNTQFKTKGISEFIDHRDRLKEKINQEDYFLIILGRRLFDNGVYFGSFHNSIDFIAEKKSVKHTEDELQEYFKGFFDYIVSHYSYLHIPVETDPFAYTKLETSEMQKLMDKNIQTEIENAITQITLRQINKDLDKFVNDVEKTLINYEYKGHYKNSLTMPDLVSKIIEAYFSIKVLNRKTENSRNVPVQNLSSGEKRKALIDVAYSFLMRESKRDKKIILAIDEPESSLHISACFEQFEKLMKLSKNNHQVLITTHWYGYLPIVAEGNAAAIQKKSNNEINIDFFDLYNYREKIAQERSMHRGPLPYDINIKSYNDLVQSIVFSLLKTPSYNWIICEGISEKLYFEHYFKEEIEKRNLRILPVGGFKEVKKVYLNLVSPINDPDYNVNGKVICLIDTDSESIDVEYKKNKNLIFKRLLNYNEQKTLLEDISSKRVSPPTEIEDCLEPTIYFETLKWFSVNDEDLKPIFETNLLELEALNSAQCMDLKKSEYQIIKKFFDKNNGVNKVHFANKYIEFCSMDQFSEKQDMEWIKQIKNLINN
ncbi:AAA family ATPase [Marinilabilia salmonicolor]|uniref:Putative ATP-dependent endonuclease of OLD family n=1 Tax=Marinilabilia salmonicolor TaxID=989 RepID=A0A368ULJ5_9BACT|nr:AAA family ATPase [Marinilabilia salmonicolor]RCW29647.1 putative ATP-dependent endonuclease of OLD family [Marinilabilia salmonicolor]